MIAVPSIRKRPPISILGGDVPTLFYSDPLLGGDGKVRINPDKTTVKWQWLTASLDGVSPINLDALNTRKATITIHATDGKDEGDFEAVTMLARTRTEASEGRVAIQPYVNSPTISRFLSNIVIPSNLLSGTAQLPGSFLQAIYCLPKTSWTFEIRSLSALETDTTVALFGRKFHGCSPCQTEKLRKRAEHLKWFHPYWIGPQDPTQVAYTGPEVTLSPGQVAYLTFPVPSDADFVLCGMLDDSTSSGGGEPSLYAQPFLNISGRGMVDLPGSSVAAANSTPQGISWRDFLAIPTVASVTGFPRSTVNAYSLAPNWGGWTQIVPRNSQFVIRFQSTEAAATITLRPALFGFLVYGKQPEGIRTSVDGAANRERIRQGEDFLRRMGLTSAFAGGPPV